MKTFLPTKILDKKWADKLLSGDVFLRSLNDFGGWNILKEEGLNNNFRGDVGEGLIRNIDINNEPSFFDTLDPNFRKNILGCAYIEEVSRYYKLFCMYGLEYNINTKEYTKPDERLLDFGDTSIVLYNYQEFIMRIARSLYKKFRDNVNIEIREVRYYDIRTDFGYFDKFYKSNAYSWQQEIRIAIALLDKDDSFIRDDGWEAKKIIKDISSLNLNIGDIRDISVPVDTKDLVNLKLPVELLNIIQGAE